MKPETEQNLLTPPALKNYEAVITLVKIALQKPRSVYVCRGAFANKDSAILVCAGNPSDVEAVLEFGERLKQQGDSQVPSRNDASILQQPKEQKTEMKITKIGYGIQMRDRYSGIAEEIYMEAEIDNIDRESLNLKIDKLKQKARSHLANANETKVLAASVIALEKQVTFHQQQLKTLRAQLDKLTGIWSAIESLFGKFRGGDRLEETPGKYNAEPKEQQQH